MTDEKATEKEEQQKALANRNKALAWTLIGAVVLVFFVTLAKLKGNIAG